MARIALVAGPDPGHLFPIAGLAVALHDRGHTVRVCSGGPWLSELDRDGPATLAPKDVDVDVDDRSLSVDVDPDRDAGSLRTSLLPMLGPTNDDGDIAHIIWRRAGEMAPPLFDQLQPWRPDLVVTDILTTVGHLVGDLLEVPVVSVCPHHLMDPDPDIPPVGLGRAPTWNPLRRFDDATIRRRQRSSLASGRRVRDQVREALDLPPGHHAQARLLCTLPSLEFRRRHWPEATYVVGPLEWEPASWARLQPPQGEEPLVVVTDSTASSVDDSLGEVALRVLAGLPIRLVVTSNAEPRREGNVVVGRGSHAALLDQAAVAVGPGGGGFIGKSLSRGVPMAIVRGIGDQRESARRVVEAGAGLAVPPGPRLGPRLRGAVQRLLDDDDLRGGAARLRDEAARLGPDHAARIVERHLS